ncbi:SNF5 / SMARCB1 / INI1 [Plasmodiophora brassicae]|uniref:Uncharacterized protein n=1 Tax=Plasmodiophora brassicae TaxID=37360 RepID=A0A0G4IZ94_PLABS|nr:hypothetical protein PBRA_001513 [Plasmodiophora brassicae]SPQ94038.1 unnamed protein product [Plasmodiophora brassicae]
MAIPAGLREALAEIMRRNQIGIPELARQAGVLPAQLAQFLQGSLPEDVQQQIATRLQEWMQVLQQRQQAMRAGQAMQHVKQAGHGGMSPKLKTQAESKLVAAPAPENDEVTRFAARLASMRRRNVFCPIRIDETFKTTRYQDEFIWNLNNAGLTPDTFATLLLKDVGLPDTAFKEPIRKSILRQIAEFQAVMQVDPKLALEDSKKGLLVLDLDMLLNGYRLVDTLYWDPYSMIDSVEEFSESMCTDLGLGGEWAAKVAFEIRWKLLQHRKAIHTKRESPLKRHPYPTDVLNFVTIDKAYQMCNKDMIQAVGP